MISELRIINSTVGGVVGTVTREHDDRFSALVPIVPGPNTIEILARSPDGRERVAIHTVSQERTPLTANERCALKRLLKIEAEGKAGSGPRRKLAIEVEADGESN